MLPSQGAASQGVYPYGLNMMERLKMESFDVVGNHVSQIAALFPNCVTERLDKDGKPVRAVDFEKLREELTGEIIEEGAERYQFTWPDKRKANQLANTPTKMTLRPCREESVDFEHTENLYIEGDNLDVLKVIREAYLGKVKMIYIDPPYNTGNDFVYNDDFASSYEEFAESCKVYDEEGNLTFDPKANGESNGRFHTDWLNMIYPRLKVARDLLAEDGVIFISIDDNEDENLRKVCDEIFGEQNFVAQLVWERAYSPKNDAKFISNSHDYILMYARNINSFQIGRLPRTEEANARYSNPDNDPRGVWKPSDISVKTYNPESDYPITTPSGRVVEPPAGRCWSLSKKAFFERLQDNRIWFGPNGDSVPSMKRFLTELKFEGMAPTSILFYKEVGHSQEGAKELVSLMGDKGVFDGPKPIRLLYRLLTLANLDKDSIILDFFSGSASTAHALMKLNAEDGGNRKFIMIQLPETTDDKARKAGYQTICEIGKERIRRAGKQILDSMQTSAGGDLFSQTEKAPKLDIGFRVLKLAESNMEDVYYTPDQFEMKDLFRQADNVKPDRTGMDLLFQVMLQCGCLLSEKITVSRIGGKEVFNVADGYLIACFDKDVSEDVIAEIAKQQPVYFVMRDASAASDNVMDNFDQLFRHYSPDTIRRIL
jgi:adenine-specific DNA-methyltransferase